MKINPFYPNRQAAGRLLASFFKQRLETPALVLSLPRGGTIVAAEIARTLNVDHQLIMVRKIGSPYDPEVAIGALAMDGQFIPNTRYIEALSISAEYIENQCALERKELARRLACFTPNTVLPNLSEFTVIIVDDGIATGYTTEAALRWLQSCRPKQTILTTPVAATDTVPRLTALIDILVCPLLIGRFTAVGNYYDDFKQISDSEVQAALDLS